MRKKFDIMAEGNSLSSSDKLMLNFENSSITNDIRMLLTNLYIKYSRQKWVSDFDTLKKFVKECIDKTVEVDLDGVRNSVYIFINTAWQIHKHFVCMPI